MSIIICNIKSRNTIQVAINKTTIGTNYLFSTLNTNKTVNGFKVTRLATEDMVFGDVGYITSNGGVALADASVIATAKAVVMCADSSIKENNSGNWLLQGLARNDAWDWTPGGYIYLSVNGSSENTLSQSIPEGTDECLVVLGYAFNTKEIYFNPQFMIIERY